MMALTKKHGNIMVKSPICCSFHANFWSTPPGLGTDRRSLRPPQPRKMSRPGETPEKTKRERHGKSGVNLKNTWEIETL